MLYVNLNKVKSLILAISSRHGMLRSLRFLSMTAYSNNDAATSCHSERSEESRPIYQRYAMGCFADAQHDSNFVVLRTPPLRPGSIPNTQKRPKVLTFRAPVYEIPLFDD